MRRVLKLTFLALLVALVSLAGYAVGGRFFSLRRTSEEIRQALLVETPIGSSFEEALQRLRERGYSPAPSNNGFYRQEAGQLPTTVGVSSIRVTLGDYWWIPFLNTTVTGFWGFDSNGRLIDVWVWNTTDSP